ncbi:hypothetical protein GGR52DRAFT_569590 [Hypoxylon sp. FL1284]|nr:hypothetical protein GGR52DRAFT_569590 [Hypoxylon sp. FL1284]
MQYAYCQADVAAFAGFVFVDQAPFQDHAPDWDTTRAHAARYDEGAARAAQHAWIASPERAARDGLVPACLGYRHAPAADEAAAPGYELRRMADGDFFAAPAPAASRARVRARPRAASIPPEDVGPQPGGWALRLLAPNKMLR